MQKQRKLSGSLQDDYLPLYFRGDSQLFKYVDLKFQATLNLQKQHIFSLPLRTFNIERQGFVQPLAQIQTLDELSRQTMLKNKSLIKEGIFYVYFPSNIRVDEKIFKIYDKNYENFLKEVPKNFRSNFAKFIIWEEGTGEQNIQSQKHKLQQALSNYIKSTVQKKLDEFTKQIATLQSLQLNQRVLRSLFVSRNKVASIYKQLKLSINACEHYSSLFNEIVYNFKKFQGPTSSKQLSTQRTQYKSPFIIRDINKVFTLFESRNYLLHITNFCFTKMLESHLDALQHYEGMKRFKQYIDFVLSNILNVVSSREDDVGKNIWIIETIDKGYKIMRQKPPASIMNAQREEEYSLMRVSVCSQYRNAIERIGVIFYGLNTYIVFPRNLEYELTLCIKSMYNQPLTESEYPEMKVVNRHHQVNKMLFLSGQPVTDTIEAILNNFDSFKHVYVKTLELMEKTLSESPYKKVSWSMKLSVLKATIIYFNLKDQKRTSIASLLEENTNFSYESKKSVWQKLQIINKVYQLTLCQRYSIKMRVEDLLNIILDDSIIHLEKIWMEVVKIVSRLLFDYKKGETEEEAERLNTIEYGEGDEEESLVNRKKRRTTIHYDERKIQVGTLKFISVVDCVDSFDYHSQEIDNNTQNSKENENNRIRLNIEVSNRIISYAEALIQKSKTQRVLKETTEIQNPLISLKFLVKTIRGQQMTIPFQIIQTQDKFIEVQILSSQVIIFTIQKLLIDISDSITLVYTMPINHEKIQFYEKKEMNSQVQEDYYVNICPELKINTLQLFSPNPLQQHSEPLNFQYRKESTSSISSRPNSQTSTSKSSHVLYNKLWTPLKFTFGLTPNDQLEIQKIQIHCQDEIHQKVFVGQKQLNYKQISNYKISSSDYSHIFPLIIFAKPSQRQQSTKQQPNYSSATKPHKQSINILPKSLRNRTQSLSRSITSAPSNASADSNRISIRIHLKHNGYAYQANKEIGYCKKVPFKVDYRYSQEFEEYTIKNIIDQQLEVLSEQCSFDLFPYEELKVFSPFVNICLNYQEESLQSDSQNEEPLNLMRVMKLDEKVDLKSLIKKQHLKPEKISSIWMDLEQKIKEGQKEVYSIFEPVRIRAEQCGLISVLKWNSSEYELVGKVEGVIEYMSESKDRLLDLWLIPTKKGLISLPEISINSKKGVWQNGKRIKVA